MFSFRRWDRSRPTGHVPTPGGDHDYGEPAANCAANYLRAGAPEPRSRAGSHLATDDPAQHEANSPGNEREDGRAQQPCDAVIENRRRNPDCEQATNAANNRAHHRTHFDALVHKITYLWSIGTKGLGSGPIYSAVGRMSRLLLRCSMICADHPDVRAMTNMGVYIAVGTPQKR